MASVDYESSINPVKVRVVEMVTLAILLLAAIPVALSVPFNNFPGIKGTMNKGTWAIDFYGFLVTAIVLGFAAWQLRKDRTWQRALVVGIPALLTLHFAEVSQEYSSREPSYDFKTCAAAAMTIGNGASPYQDTVVGTDYGYIYPPLTAMGLKAVIDKSTPYVVEHGAPPEFGIQMAFYAWQFLGIITIGAFYGLAFAFLRQLRLSQVATTALLGVFFGFNGIIIRNLAYSQVNILVLCTSLAAVLLADTIPVLGGAFAALGTHIKLYPATLIFSWASKSKAQAFAGFAAMFVFLLGLQTSWFKDFGLIENYANTLKGLPPTEQFRDDSLTRVVSFVGLGSIAPLAGKVLGVAAICWMVWRMVQRGKMNIGSVPNVFGSRIPFKTWKTLADGSDFIAVGLLIAPMVWEYNYIHCMPLLFLVLATRAIVTPTLGLVAYALIFAPPIFDVAVFSFHRLAGLLLLLWLSEPARVKKQIEGLELQTRIGEEFGVEVQHDSVPSFRMS